MLTNLKNVGTRLTSADQFWPVGLHFLRLSPKALGSGLQSFQALPFTKATDALKVGMGVQEFAWDEIW